MLRLQLLLTYPALCIMHPKYHAVKMAVLKSPGPLQGGNSARFDALAYGLAQGYSNKNATALIVSHISASRQTPEEREARLADMCSFLSKMARYDAAEAYLAAITVPGALDLLTSKKILEFAEGLYENSKHYFYAIHVVGSADALASDAFIGFARTTDKMQDFYFSAIDDARNLFSEAAERRAVSALASTLVVNKTVLDFAERLGDAAPYYFSAIAKTGNTSTLTDDRTRGFISDLDGIVNQSNFLLIAGHIGSSEGISKLIELCARIGASMVLREDAELVRNVLNFDISLITDRQSLDSVITYFLAKGKLPVPDARNMPEYPELVRRYLYSTYGLGTGLNSSQMRMIFSLHPNSIPDLVSIINNSSEKAKKSYSISGKVPGASADFHTEEGKRKLRAYVVSLLVYGRGTCSEGEAVLRRIAGERILHDAVYELSLRKWEGSRRKAQSLAEHSGAEEAYRYLVKSAGKNKAIAALLAVAEGRTESDPRDVLVSVVSNNPLDFDNRDLMACIFLPNGEHRESIIPYTTDPRAMLIRYDNNEGTIGVAITLLDEKNKALFVNSVEGTPALRRKEVIGIVLVDLTERAIQAGAERIIFMARPISTTATGFIAAMKAAHVPAYDDQMRFDISGFRGRTDTSTGLFPGYELELAFPKSLAKELIRPDPAE